jgi:hypothetical protein
VRNTPSMARTLAPSPLPCGPTPQPPTGGYVVGRGQSGALLYATPEVRKAAMMPLGGESPFDFDMDTLDIAGEAHRAMMALGAGGGQATPTMCAGEMHQASHVHLHSSFALQWPVMHA